MTVHADANCLSIVVLVGRLRSCVSRRRDESPLRNGVLVDRLRSCVSRCWNESPLRTGGFAATFSTSSTSHRSSQVHAKKQ